MSEYVVLLPGNEAAWEAAPQEEKQHTYGRHNEFARLLEERGHKVVGGSELAHSREAKVLRTARDGTQTITDGPPDSPHWRGSRGPGIGSGVRPGDRPVRQRG